MFFRYNLMKCVFSRKPLIFAQLPHRYTFISKYSNENDSNYNQADKFRTQETVFESTRGRDLFQNRVENRENVSAGYQGGQSISLNSNSQEDDNVTAYNCSDQTVRLSSVMQTNVPEPFSITGKAPVHLNMPGGAHSQNQKYLSEQQQSTHQQNQADTVGKNHNYIAKRYCHQDQGNRLKGFKETTAPSPPPPSSPLTKPQKLKQAIRDYGSTVIVFHVTISLASLGGCYLAISSGIDLASLLEKWDTSHHLGSLSNQVAVGGGTFVIAYAIHKLFAPIRIAITLFTVPIIVKSLRKKGILKPPQNKNIK